MSAINMNDLLQAHANSGKLYYEFLREESLSSGIYRLAAGSTDPQQPHTEDEIYFVIEGRAEVLIGEDIHGVDKGSVIFVPAHIEHRFQNIVEDLTLLVFFAPAEYSQTQPAGKN